MFRVLPCPNMSNESKTLMLASLSVCSRLVEFGACTLLGSDPPPRAMHSSSSVNREFMKTSVQHYVCVLIFPSAARISNTHLLMGPFIATGKMLRRQWDCLVPCLLPRRLAFKNQQHPSVVCHIWRMLAVLAMKQMCTR